MINSNNSHTLFHNKHNNIDISLIQIEPGLYAVNADCSGVADIVIGYEKAKHAAIKLVLDIKNASALPALFQIDREVGFNEEGRIASFAFHVSDTEENGRASAIAWFERAFQIASLLPGKIKPIGGDGALLISTARSPGGISLN